MTQPQQAEQAQASESHAQAQGEFALPPATVPSHVGQRALAQPRALTSMDVLALQRSIGNRETARLLAPMRQSPSTAKPAPHQEMVQAEREVTPITPPQISSGEPLIQRVWATLEGKDRRLNLKKIEGETIDGQQVYEHTKSQLRYVRVDKLSKNGNLVVKALPARAQKAFTPGKAPIGKSTDKRREKQKENAKEKKHKALMQKRKFVPSPDYTHFLGQFQEYKKNPKKKIDESSEDERDKDYDEKEFFDDEHFVEDNDGSDFDDSEDSSGEDSDDERLRITEEREEKGVFANLYTMKKEKKSGGLKTVKTGKHPTVLLITFNLEKYGMSTITKTGDIAQVVRNAVGKIVDTYNPTVLAFQEVTNAKIFLDGMTYQRKAPVQGIKDLSLLELNFESEMDYQDWQTGYKERFGQDKLEEDSEKLKLSNTYGIDPGPSFKSQKGGNPESYPLIYDESKVLNKPTYYIWKKNKLAPAPKTNWINLSPDDDEDQTPRPVIYAKLEVSTSETSLRSDEDSITMYVGIIHTSPSMQSFATYVDGIRKEYELVKKYVEGQGATAMLLGDVYAEKSAKTFLNNIEKSTTMTSMLPEYESNMTLKKATKATKGKKAQPRTVQLNQRADMAVIPSYLKPLDQARNLLPPDYMPSSMDEHHEEKMIRDKAKGKEKKEKDDKYREGIKTWRDINIDHTPVLVSLEVILDKDGEIEGVKRKKS